MTDAAAPEKTPPIQPVLESVKEGAEIDGRFDTHVRRPMSKAEPGTWTADDIGAGAGTPNDGAAIGRISSSLPQPTNEQWTTIESTNKNPVFRTDGRLEGLLTSHSDRTSTGALAAGSDPAAGTGRRHRRDVWAALAEYDRNHQSAVDWAKAMMGVDRPPLFVLSDAKVQLENGEQLLRVAQFYDAKAGTAMAVG